MKELFRHARETYSPKVSSETGENSDILGGITCQIWVNIAIYGEKRPIGVFYVFIKYSEGNLPNRCLNCLEKYFTSFTPISYATALTELFIRFSNK